MQETDFRQDMYISAVRVRISLFCGIALSSAPLQVSALRKLESRVCDWAGSKKQALSAKPASFASQNLKAGYIGLLVHKLPVLRSKMALFADWTLSVDSAFAKRTLCDCFVDAADFFFGVFGEICAAGVAGEEHGVQIGDNLFVYELYNRLVEAGG